LFTVYKYAFLVIGALITNAANPVHSVFYLVILFLNVGFYTLVLGAEFLGLVLMLVYAGAISVLFLFVIMMLNIRHTELRANASDYTISILPMFLVVMAGLMALSALNFPVNPVEEFDYIDYYMLLDDFENIDRIGMLLYTKYSVLMLMIGIVMLEVMLSAILLTISHDPDIRRSHAFEQTSRDARVLYCRRNIIQ
jgi:NADH-quinone oxidoreductase subunit J